MYRINDVANRVGLSQKRIREYEKEGFIKPDREARTNNRLYGEFEVKQVQRINQLIHEHGFTVACLRNLMVLAPCWNIFDCENREACPAYQNPHEPCWRLFAGEGEANGRRCRRCAVYLNREVERKRILNPAHT